MFSDFRKMINEIIDYVIKTNAKIYMCDDPMSRTIGFRAFHHHCSKNGLVYEIMEEDTPTWEMNIADLELCDKAVVERISDRAELAQRLSALGRDADELLP